MGLIENILLHGTLAGILLILYILPIMRFLSPRIWAFSDYPKVITESVESQTKRERRIATAAGLPFVLLMIGYPLLSTLFFENISGGSITFLEAFLNTFGVLMIGNLADWLFLDMIIVGTWTPDWVIIPGTESMKETAYKDFRIEHTKGHIYGTIAMAIISLIIAGVVVIF
ncbi:hypothetical protein EU528_04360 [Candidatus Thorarchaeota archaeon]|nr:MAG: hypothetical protein EU528_04360 [Candidatus Thorarchaeota archaeon]